MIVRAGLPHDSGQIPGVCFDREYPALLSANSLWTGDRFKAPASTVCDLNLALDSAGYVAMKRYQGYRWSCEQYAELSGLWGWAWWASMDIACEPDLLLGEVKDRIWRTAWNLARLRQIIETWKGAGVDWLTNPMPVIQGWAPDDYKHSADLTDTVLDEWPELVGVGSVCGRSWGGPNGLPRVLRALDECLPPGVRLHLFGVKGTALARLRSHPRVESVDSAAWNFRARSCANHKERCPARPETGNPVSHTVFHLKQWMERQGQQPSQLGLFSAKVAE